MEMYCNPWLHTYFISTLQIQNSDKADVLLDSGLSYLTL